MDNGGKLTITLKLKGSSRVAVRFKDTGPGIPAENLPYIFEPFFTTKKGSGTGLGPSITYGIVEKLGGEIKVSSKVDQGTRFTIILPIRRRSKQ